MSNYAYWAGWLVSYIIGAIILDLLDAPSWAIIIGGWVIAFGVMNRADSK